MTHYVRLIFLGDYSSARKAIRHIRGDLTGLTAQIRMIAMVGPAAVGAALATIPLAFAGLGAYAVFYTKEVSEAFAHMKDHVMGHLTELAKGFIPVLTDIFKKAEQSFDRISPMLAKIFAITAPYITQLGEAVLRFAETIMPAFYFAIRRSQPLIDALVAGIDALGQGFAMFIRNLAIATPSAAMALKDLLQLLGDLLPILGRIIAVLTTGFGPIIGQLSFAIQGFGFAVLDFVKHLTAAAPAIKTIFEAWIGFWAGMLKILGPVVEALLNGLAPIVVEVRRLLLALAGTLGDMVIPIIKALAQPIADVVGAFTNALMPSLNLISQAFTDMTPLLVEVGKSLGEVLVAAINALKPILKPLVDLALQLLQMFLGWIPPILKIAEDLMPVLGKVLQVVVKEGLIPMVQPIMDLAKELMPMFIDVLGQVAGIFTKDILPVLIEAARQLFPALVDVIKLLVPIVLQLAKDVLPILVQMFKDLAPIIGDLARIIIPVLVDILREVVVPLIRDVVAPVFKMLGQDVLPALAGVFRDVIVPLLRDIVVPVIKLLAEVFKQDVIPIIRDYVIPILKVALPEACRIVKEALDNLTREFRIQFQGFKDFFAKLRTDIPGAVGDLWDVLRPSGIRLMAGFMDGIASQTIPLYDTIKKSLEPARALFPSSPPKEGPFAGSNYTLYTGAKLMQDFAEGARSIDLQGIFSKILSGIGGYFNSTPGGGATAGANIPGIGAIQLKVAPGADSALASLLMNMVRTGQLQLQRA